MAADEFNANLERIGWPRRELARRLGMASDRTVRRWTSGEMEVPAPVTDWMRRVARLLEETAAAAAFLDPHPRPPARFQAALWAASRSGKPRAASSIAPKAPPPAPS